MEKQKLNPVMSRKPGPSIYALDDWTVLAVGGADASDFLHGQFTNDLLALPDNRAQLSAYCMPKGQMIANFLVWRTSGNQYRIALPSGLDEAVLQRLQLFKLRCNVEIESLAESFSLFGVTGSYPEDNPESPVELPRSPLSKMETDPYTAIAWPGQRARWLVISPQDATSTLWGGGKAPGSGSDLWRLWDIEDGIAFVRAENREQFVPQHLNLDLVDAISFSKGCYPGQEVVARMKYRGQVKFRTYRLSGNCDETPVPGDPIHLSEDPDVRPCGRVVDACVPPDGGPCQMLASVRAADASQPLRAQRPDGPSLEPLPLPYQLT